MFIMKQFQIKRTKMGRKKNYMDFSKKTNPDVYNKMSRTWLHRGNFKREMELLLITALNNAIRTKYIKDGIEENPKD